MAFTATPVDGSATPIPMSSVVPDGTNTPLALEGGPSIVTGGNTLAPASMYVKDGNDVTLGLTTQTKATDGTTTSWSVIQLLKGIFDKLLGSIAVTGTFWQATQPVSLAANQSVNAAQVAGTNTSVNAGNRDAGTQRIIESGNPTSIVTQVASAAIDTSLLAANANKKGTLFFNDSIAILYLLYGTGVASATNYSVQIPAKGFFEDPLHYTGGFHGIWASANGFVYCTEVS